MTSIPCFIIILQELGHDVKLMITSASEVRDIRIKSAKCIFKQSKMAGHLDDSDKFSFDLVDTSGDLDGNQYYGTFIYVPSTTSHMQTFEV